MPAFTQPSEIGALLRREDLYSSQVSESRCEESFSVVESS